MSTPSTAGAPASAASAEPLISAEKAALLPAEVLAQLTTGAGFVECDLPGLGPTTVTTRMVHYMDPSTVRLLGQHFSKGKSWAKGARHPADVHIAAEPAAPKAQPQQQPLQQPEPQPQHKASEPSVSNEGGAAAAETTMPAAAVEARTEETPASPAPAPAAAASAPEPAPILVAPAPAPAPAPTFVLPIGRAGCHAGSLVEVAGSFDGWTGHHPLALNADGSAFVGSLPASLAASLSAADRAAAHFKFIVDGAWRCDEGRATVADASGHHNHMLEA